jgi:hypothetical protein
MKHRSAKTGRAVSDKYAARHKSTTVREGKSKDTLRLDWLLKMASMRDCLFSSRKEVDAAMKADA